jgi:hypothetical protein
MATTTADAFNQFKERLALTDSQRKLVKSRRETCRGHLVDAFPSSSDMPVIRTKLIGSAERQTIIRPLEDIDVLAVFGEDGGAWTRYRRNSQTFLYRVRDALAEYRVETVGARGQAVRLFYKTPPHVDIAPVFVRDSGGFLLPAGNGSWLATDPLYADVWLAERDEQLDGKLRPFVRMLRRWNREHSRYFKSFHLEVMAARFFRAIGGNSRSALHLFFSNVSVEVNDPFTGYSLADYLPRLSTRRANAVDSLKSACRHAKAALDAEGPGNHSEAIRQWRIVFGDEFPAYG